jgi:hypothetical protein
MPALLSVMQLIVSLLPEAEAALPAIEALIAGQTVTLAQEEALWTAVTQLEALASAKAATVEAAPQA